ncbi:MAG: cytidine deaminase [Alphaproteobacteria bacterium]
MAGSVGCALVTDQGNVYVGGCIDTSCGLGFCAECNAIGTMVTDGESRIITIVAVDRNQQIMAPCGKCREFIYQVNPDNLATRIMARDDKIMQLKELLPEPWLAQQ